MLVKPHTKKWVVHYKHTQTHRERERKKIHAHKKEREREEEEREKSLGFIRDTQSFMRFVLLESLGGIVIHW